MKNTIKKTVLTISAILIAVISFAQAKDASYYRSKGYQVFERFNLAVKAPVKLFDISDQAQGDFAMNYGGVVDDGKSTMAAYQIMVTNLPHGYLDYSESEIKNLVDDLIKARVSGFNNVKKIYFGEDDCPGYSMETSIYGYKQKSVMFYRNGHIYAVSVISNYQLEQRFNQFTNGVKFF